MISLLAITVLLPSPAQAFCGTYVGGADADLFNNASQVAYVRFGDITTLTMANDVDGNFDDFAMVIPVPEVIQEDNVHVLEPELFDRLDQYSQPRAVSYVCEDFEPDYSDSAGTSDGGSSDGGTTGGVEVEAEYIVGEYEIVVLSATQSTGLLTWLDDNGFTVPLSSQEMLQDYIDAGTFFLAAKVGADAGILPGDELSPLQLRYQADVMMLPVRLGTLNSPGVQDLIIYGITSYSDGAMAISNWPEITVEDECLWKDDGQGLGAFYDDLLQSAWEEQGGGASWVREYGWYGGNCDPCSGSPPDETDLTSLGVDESLINYSEYFFTRLHARYTPQGASQDVSLYLSGLASSQQQRYIVHETYLEDRWPVCSEGMVINGGSCDEASPWFDGGPDLGGDGTGGSGGDSADSGGCTAVPVGSGLAWLAGLVALGCGRRRR